MREFVVRCRGAPVDPARFLASVGSEPHVEFLAQVVLSAMFIAGGHRDDTILWLVLESSGDYSRTLCLDGRLLGNLQGMHETALLTTLADALSAGRSLSKEERATAGSGITVAALSFEHLVKQKAQSGSLYVLDRRGTDIRESPPPGDAVFVMSDHIPMPRKTLKWLERLGARRVSLGPVTLHTSQCLVLVHNELDRLS